MDRQDHPETFKDEEEFKLKKSSSKRYDNTLRPHGQMGSKDKLRLADMDLTDDQERAMERLMSDPQRRIRALAQQKYHLPGNNWRQDWRQYFANNHPLFGICCHFREHPVGWGMRTMCFISSVVFGLCITNLFWLWARESQNSTTLVVVETGSKPGSNLTGYVVNVDEENNVEVTTDLILLWTLGGFIHGCFDNLIWTLSICACCDPGGRFHYLAKYKRFGVGLLAFFIMIIIGVTTLSVVIRGVMEADEEEEAAQAEELRSAGVTDDEIQVSASTKENYEFLMGYSVELCLAMLVYFPLTGSILFWGGLGCYKYPYVGGRPYEVKEEEEKLMEILNDPEKVRLLAQNPSPSEIRAMQDDEEGEEIWGMRKKNESGEYEADEPPCCRWCLRGNNNDYPKVTRKHKKEDVGRSASVTSFTRSKQESSYPKVAKKNKTEEVGRAALSSSANSKSEQNYPKADRNNKKEEVGRSSTSSKSKRSSRSKSPSKRSSSSSSRRARSKSASKRSTSSPSRKSRGK